MAASDAGIVLSRILQILVIVRRRDRLQGASVYPHFNAEWSHSNLQELQGSSLKILDVINDKGAIMVCRVWC